MKSPEMKIEKRNHWQNEPDDYGYDDYDSYGHGKYADYDDYDDYENEDYGHEAYQPSRSRAAQNTRSSRSRKKTGGYAPISQSGGKKSTKRDIAVAVAGVLVSLVIIFVMIFNAPIINFEKMENGVMTTQQVSILKYWKLWQPLVQQEGTLSKVDSADVSKLDLKSDLDSGMDDGLNLEQTIEGQYTILFLGMDESGELSDVDWVFQFDLINGTMNILQIPRDSYMPDYASFSTAKFNSIYHSGQETGVTPIQRVVDAIQDNFCIYIDCYVKLNCVDIAKIVDSISGIPINLPEEIVYEADKVLPQGEQTLSGQQSEWFIRFRHGYMEGDIGRVKAQRIFLAAAMEKMLNMSQTELMSAMQKIYKNQWIATDLSLEQISMVADFASSRLSMDSVNVFMVPGEGAMYYPSDGSGQSVYSIHKQATIDLLNKYFRPYQNEIYPEESTIVELVPEGEYQASDYDDTQETLSDIHDGDTKDGAQ